MSEGERLLSAQRERWEHGDDLLVEDILREQPALPAEVILDLSHQEILLRERGERPSLTEYTRRFPALAADLQLHFEVHEAASRTGPPSRPSHRCRASSSGDGR